MRLETKRWLILAAGIAANLCQGAAYTSSVFMKPLGEYLKRPQTEWSLEWRWIFAMSLALLPVGMVLAGKLADMGKTKFTVALGGVLFGSGLILAGYGNSVAWMMVTFGAMTSLGSGCAYGTIVGAAVRWFPDRRGLASGLAVGAVGFGPVILAPIAKALIGSYGVMGMFKGLGVGSLVIMLLAAYYVVNPPAGYIPAGWVPPLPKTSSVPIAENLPWWRMLGRPLFWVLYASYVCGAFAGILLNGLAAPIAEELAGFSSERAMWAVLAFALASASGRVLWGFVSDFVGRVATLGLVFLLSALAMLVLYGWVGAPGFYLPCVIIVGLCYGGVLGTFPSLCAEAFGTKNAATNYAFLFSAFTVAALTAPYVIGYYRAQGADRYPIAFLIAGVVALVGLVLTFIISKLNKKTLRNYCDEQTRIIDYEKK